MVIMTTPKVQLNCMDEFCGSKIISRKGEYPLDGIKCPVCDGLVMPRPYNEKDDHIYYEDHKNPRLYRQKHECLNCGHDGMVEGIRGEHSKVKVCPQCTRGAFVDKWFIHQHRGETIIPNNVFERLKNFIKRNL